jgi:hypothetical protein
LKAIQPDLFAPEMEAPKGADLPMLRADRNGICPRCHTFIRAGSRIVRLTEPEAPWTADGRSCWRTDGFWYWDGRLISQHPRWWVHWHCYVEVMVEDEPCVYCGAGADTVDHVIPRRAGGSDQPRNLVPACRSCNSKKGTLPAEIVGLTGRERTLWLRSKGWTSVGGTKTWLNPSPSDRAFYTKAVALRVAAFGPMVLNRNGAE